MIRTLATPIGTVDQIGIVVPDMDKAIDLYGRMFGIEEWISYTYTQDVFPWAELRGEPGQFEMELAMSGAGPQVELIQPLTGPSVYHEYTETGRWGLHHLGVFVDDLDVAIATMAEAGYAVTQTARGYGLNGDGAFAYFDTEKDLQLIIEAIEIPNVRRPGVIRRTGERRS
jgi:catechol 2,3-dioxygenase-like lactoylglutathione lyase family enzyme